MLGGGRRGWRMWSGWGVRVEVGGMEKVGKEGVGGRERWRMGKGRGRGLEGNVGRRCGGGSRGGDVGKKRGEVGDVGYWGGGVGG